MRTLDTILSDHPFFKDLEQSHLFLIGGCALNVRFEANQMIAREGDPADHFYVIREGQVALEISAAGRGVLRVETVSQGDVLGFSWLIPPHTWRFGARAVTPTRAIALDGKCLRQKCDEDHGLGYELLKRFTRVVTDRLEATRIQLLDVYGTNR